MASFRAWIVQGFRQLGSQLLSKEGQSLTWVQTKCLLFFYFLSTTEQWISPIKSKKIYNISTLHGEKNNLWLYQYLSSVCMQAYTNLQWQCWMIITPQIAYLFSAIFTFHSILTSIFFRLRFLIWQSNYSTLISRSDLNSKYLADVAKS